MKQISFQTHQKTLQNIVWILFLLLIFSLSIGTPIIYFQNLRLTLTDIIFPIVSFVFLVTILLGHLHFRWHKFYLFLLFYFAVMVLSTIFSANPRQSLIKLSGEIYLLGLVILTFNSVRTEKDFKQVIQTWLCGTLLTILVGFLTIFLFYFQRDNWILQYTTSIYGAVPVGNYPRLTSIFISSSMFCNYLSVSLILLLIAEKLDFIKKKLCRILVCLLLICAVFTISSGLGGIVFTIGVWIWICYKNSKNNFARISFVGGISVAFFFFVINFFALQKYPNAPYSIRLPFFEVDLLPSPRLLVWSDSLHTFAENVLTGKGLGLNSCEVVFQNTDGNIAYLTDAHNIFLSVASQNGIFGLIAISAIIYYFVRKFSLSFFNLNNRKFLQNALILAFISAFFYQGLTGSFEDTRHLWVLIGFILSSETLEKTNV
jgi:putative inorganic carbon (hco3(-)) transporter